MKKRAFVKPRVVRRREKLATVVQGPATFGFLSD
jgi:hypothetical protein